jgi:hypothetical protein
MVGDLFEGDISHLVPYKDISLLFRKLFQRFPLGLPENVP